MKKTIFITGASSGFGKQAAKLFQQKGWNVVATMRSPEKEQDLQQAPDLLLNRLDVQDTSSIKTAVEQAISQFGRIDVLLNNAGYGLIGVFESATPEQVAQQFGVNLFGLMEVTRVVLPHMRTASSGAIVNISSMGGQVAFPFGSLYHATKFAVEGLSESLAHELAPLGIRVKVVEPGGGCHQFPWRIADD